MVGVRVGSPRGPRGGGVTLKREHVHLIGIGGTGMTALAGLLDASGCRVTGSDVHLYPPTSGILKELKLEVREGFDPGNLDPTPDVVVVGNAISRGNPELEALMDQGIPYTSMPEMIARRFLRSRHSIVVTGTHGKTTTTSMMAWVLTRAGKDPSFLIGGLPSNFRHPFRLGKGSAFVIEGDEYDSAFFDKGPKFMHYRPDTALVGTVEFDHADIYRDLGQIKTAFRRMTNLVPRRGLLVRYEDCETTVEVTGAALGRVEGYGMHRGRWRAADLEETGQGCRFGVLRDERPFVDVTLKVSGEHNVRNALAVVGAAHDQGLTPEEIADGLATFEGVRRRLEFRGEAFGVAVLDDFAHHPTAIDASLGAARQRYPDGRVWAVVEPRSWSLRRNVFQDRLPAAFDCADEVILAPVFRAETIPEGERLDPGRVANELRLRGRSAAFLPGVEAIVLRLAEAVEPGDVVVVMSNGAFEGLHDRLLETLKSRQASAQQSG
jgi:UDP-N-acetylmuramate: L-alanyl-gamma-D-glutamyl-meso-diaminopimelate ligase